MRKQYEIFADYFQFYLWDREMAPKAPTDYSEEDTKRRIKTAANVVVIQPARNMDVPVELEILAAGPSDDFSNWDHVAEASLSYPPESCSCTSARAGRLMIFRWNQEHIARGPTSAGSVI